MELISSRIMATVLTIVLAAIALPAVSSSDIFAPAPSPTSDGITVDQGIACALMLAALVLTYLIH